MENKIFIFSLFIINAYSLHFPLQSLKVLSNDRISNYHKERIKKFLLFDNEYENRVDDRTSHRINNRTNKRTLPMPHNRTDPYPRPDNRTDNRTDPYPKPDNRTDNRTDPYPKPDNKTDNRTDPYPKPDNKTDPYPKPDNKTDNRTEPYPKPDNRTDNRTVPISKPDNRTNSYPKPDNRTDKKTDPYPRPDNKTDNKTNPYPKQDNKTYNRTDPYPKPDNKTDNRTDPYPKPDNRTDNKSNIELVSVNTNAVEYYIITEDFLLVFKNEDTNQKLIHYITIKKFSNGAIFRLPLYCYKKENNHFVSCLADVKNSESDIYFVIGIEYGIEFINLNRPLIFYIQKRYENQKSKNSC